MRTVTKDFQISYPLSHKVVRDLKIVTDKVGELVVSGLAYFNPDKSILDTHERYSIDIDFVEWNGTDIKAVLEVVGGMEEIETFCTKEAAKLFEKQDNGLFEMACGIVRAHAKSFYGVDLNKGGAV
jgi:hypothetical protein